EAPAPEQLAPEAPAAQEAPQVAPEQPAPEEPAAPEQPAAAPEAPQQPASDPLAQAETQIRGAIDQYNAGVARLGAGDAGGQGDIDAASATLQQLCGVLGFGSIQECAANYGGTLQPIPATPAEPQPAPTPGGPGQAPGQAPGGPQG